MLKKFPLLKCMGFVQRSNVCKVIENSAKYFSTKSESCAPSAPEQKPDANGKKHMNPFAQATNATVKTFNDNNLETQSAIDDEKYLKLLQLEADMAYQEGRRVPKLQFFKQEHWDYIVTLPSKSARFKYYSYLWQIEMRKEAEKRKKQQKADAAEHLIEKIRRERKENNHIIYGLGHTSLFLRIYDTTINHWQNSRLIRAMQFAPKIVLDCSYDDHMTRREALNAAKQLMFCFAENRANDNPFDLHYCNVNWNSICMQKLKCFIPTILNPEFPLNIHEECFTKIFPKENLVYLTPHCREDLHVYNPDDIYIVGAMVDTVNTEPLSLAKAKRLGLRMARLPLDHYLQWGAGSGKSLTINQMINVMLDIKNTGKWDVALKHVPRRKIVDMKLEHKRERKSLEQRARKFHVRISEILNCEQNQQEPKKLRARTADMQFNLDTWSSSKKKKTSSD